MRSNYLKATLTTAALAGTLLLALPAVSSAQATVSLTASAQTVTTPDGNTVPMWGWTCGDYLATPVASVGATCTALTYNTATGGLSPQNGTTWQPPLIVVPYTAGASPGVSGTNLTISLSNALPVETSIVLFGQVPSSSSTTNGGEGSPVREAVPRTDGAHQTQTATTWTTVTSAAPGTAVTGFTPPTQGLRVRSFVPEVAGLTTVGGAPAVATYTWNGLQPGTYLIRTGTYPAIQGPMGLYGVVVVTTAPVTVGTTTSPGLAYPVTGCLVTTGCGPGVTYDADVVALESEIDPRQNAFVAAIFPGGVANTGFSETAKWNAQCGAVTYSTTGVPVTATGAAPTCYPPGVDYTPKYFLINGIAFSASNQTASALSIPAAGPTGNVLLRLVNAGSHMHVPTVVGLNMLEVAEDGYVLPDVALAIQNGKALTGNPPAVTAAGTPPSQTVTAANPALAVGLQVRNEVLQVAGKVMDVIVSPAQTSTPGTYATNTYVIFDRSLALSTNGQHGVGMEAVLDIADTGAANLVAASAADAAHANADSYAYAPGVTLSVSDPGRGVIANDVGVNGVTLLAQATSGTVTLNPNGTFTYVPTGSGTDSFSYCANGSVTAGVCSSGIQATVTLSVSATVCATAGGSTCPTANPDAYSSKTATILRVAPPGVLQNDTDPNGYPLTAVLATTGCTGTGTALTSGSNLFFNADGSFTATPSAAGSYYFCYQAQNSQGGLSLPTAVSLTFLAGSGLVVTVQDGQNPSSGAITDYQWIIEQDTTIQVNPACQVNPRPTTGCLTNGSSTAPLTPATNFHSNFLPVIATGCTGPESCARGQTVYDPASGTHLIAACDGYGMCYPGLYQLPQSMPGDVNLPATDKFGRPAVYYISILPGDAQNAFSLGNSKDPSNPTNCVGGTEPSGITLSSSCGHQMGGAPIPAAVAGVYAPVSVVVEPTPLPTATVTAFIFEDDYPLNGEPDTGGGVDALATLEVPLGDFQIEIWDPAGGIGDFTGQMTYDMFNEPLTNALNGTIDPNTGLNACPLNNTQGVAAGTIVVCPQFESDGATPSPLTGQVVVRNLMQGKFSLIAHAGAAREARGEEWLQTNSLDGTRWLDSFIKAGEPPYFTEYGPGGYHVFFGEANPAIINARLTAICNGTNQDTTIPFGRDCNNTVQGQVTTLHQSRPPNEQLFSSGIYPFDPAGITDAPNYAMLGYTNCYAAIGDSDGATIALVKCDPNGNFTASGLPSGNYGVVIFDQWNDLIVDGSSRALNIPCVGTAPACTGGTYQVEYPEYTWQTHLWVRTYMDTGGLGTPKLDSQGNLDPIASPGLLQVPVRIRQPNGKFVNTLITDVSGSTRFDETFPLFAWYSVESDTTRFRATGVHAVNDAGGQLDGPAGNGTTTFGNGTTSPLIYQGALNSNETFSLPGPLQYPGTVYCAKGDVQCAATNYGTAALQNFGNTLGGNAGSAGSCTASTATAGPLVGTTNCTGLSTGRIDPGATEVEGWQGGVGQFDMLDFGKIPYAPGENGGIRGHVSNSTTRPFDDPRMLFQNLWMPLVPNVTVNLYQEGTAPDGSTTLTLVDSTTTTSWDDFAQGFHGPLSAVVVTNGGAGYTSVPTVTIVGGGVASATAATATVTGGVVTGITLNDTTTSFPNPIAVYITGGGGGGAAATAIGTIPNLSCTGQDPVNDPFFGYTLAGTTNWMTPNTALPYNAQFKCYDGYHNLNQLQPAAYDGLYEFPSAFCLAHPLGGTGANASAVNPATGKTCPTIVNPALTTTALFPATNAPWPKTGAKPAVLPSAINCGTPPAGVTLNCTGNYVVETVLPPGWELSKEEDLNLLIGDQYIAPAVQQFVGVSNIFIVPDQATIDNYNPSYTGPYTAANPYFQPYTCPPGGTTSTSGCSYTPNTTNNGSPSTNWGRTTFGDFGPGGLIIQSAPCVGQMRIVPDYLSIAPESGEVAPFAGATRALCDRKEVTLNDQMQGTAEFFAYTKVPKAATYTGYITDDFSSEFDPASPSFGEKFAVPNVPVSTKDWQGVEVSRVYTDQFGTFNGVVYSTWEVDPPNITGYSPNMMINCMNDPGPIVGPTGAKITDPWYIPSYSNFCYEDPFMPGDVVYLDTPVIPTSAFAEGYNPPDCAYPDGTPMIFSVVGDSVPANSGSGSTTGGGGPWVSESGHTLTINSLGVQSVLNNAYSGPAATTSPFNLKYVTRNYGFGTTAGSVTIGGVPVTSFTWGNTQIVATVPGGVPLCSAGGGGNPTYTADNTEAQCGELVITTANTAAAGSPSNAKQSIDTVTVTIGGRTPTYIAAENTTSNAVQKAIDASTPGDMIIVGCAAGTPPTGTTPAAGNACIYNEMLLMWKPIRLQGIGDGAVQVNASTFPPGKLLQPWRNEVTCLFGIALNAGYINNTPNSSGQPTNPYDPTGKLQCNFYNSDTTGGAITYQTVVDPTLGEPTVGWDASLNGNLAELLQEPSLMGAYEGAAITVLAKGLENNNTTNCNPEGATVAGTVTTGCVMLNDSTESGIAGNGYNGGTVGSNNGYGDCNTSSPFYQANFLCNPSRVDGISFTNSSQGGGGIWAHGWNHFLEVSNNHVFNNGGTLTGGITVGQPESVDPTASGTTNSTFQLPLLLQQHVNVHNNSIDYNTAYGDELNSNTPASAGGVSFCTGSDYYKFNYNWVCGNLSTGNGGGFAHYGFIYNGDFEHNSIVFNQSINPTLTTHGGGAIFGGQAPDGTACENASVDFDCPPALSSGAGPGLVVNANLFQGNTAEEGSGGGVRFQFMNGVDVQDNPGNPGTCGGGTTGASPEYWYCATVTNNIIVNNVAGFTGGGVSIIDSVLVNFVNNTVASNDSTASAGVLFDSLGAPNADVPPPGCNPVSNPTCNGVAITTSTPQPAGFSTEGHTANLLAAFTTATVACPTGHGTGNQCLLFSIPELYNDIFWQNRAFNIVVGTEPAPSLGLIQLTPALTQPSTPASANGVITGGTGACPTGASYWDIGTYGDGSATSIGTGNPTLAPQYSMLSSGSYSGTNIKPASAGFVSQYCNGSRVPPEIASALCTGGSTAGNAQGCIQPGQVGVSMTTQGGVPDSLTPPLPAFTLNPAATVDEGSNWINMFYGPLAFTNPTILSGAAGYGTPIGNYAPATGSAAIDAVPVSQPHPLTDFFGNARPDPAGNPNAFDIGAVEVVATARPASGSVSPTSFAFGTIPATTTSTHSFTLSNSGGAALGITSVTFTGPYSRPAGASGGTCGTTLAGGANCTIVVQFHPTTTGSQPGTMTIAASAAVTGSPVTLTGTGGPAPQGTLSFFSATGGNLTTTGGVTTDTFTIPATGRSTSYTSAVTVRNTGTAALIITAGSITVNPSGRFSISADACPAASPLAPNGTCVLRITYAAPTTQPALANMGAVGMSNNGTTGPTTTLNLSAR